MSIAYVVRSQKDKEYQLSLNNSEVTQIMQSSAGLTELTEAQTASIVGGSNPVSIVNIVPSTSNFRSIVVNVVKALPNQPITITNIVQNPTDDGC